MNSANDKTATKGFAKTLLELMKQHKCCQTTLADALGIRQSQVSNWLNDKSKPSYESIRMLIQYFGVSAEMLLGIN